MSSDKTTDISNVLRKKLRFRAWHRGTREVDLIMGHFADQALVGLGLPELKQFEALLDAPDLEVFGWVIGRDPVPAAHQNTVMTLLQNFDISTAIGRST